jgi:hypothetical protein
MNLTVETAEHFYAVVTRQAAKHPPTKGTAHACFTSFLMDRGIGWQERETIIPNAMRYYVHVLGGKVDEGF